MTTLVTVQAVNLQAVDTLVEFMYLVFTCMPGESYRRRLRSLSLHLCYLFRALINSLCVVILHERSWPRSVSGL